MGMVIDEIRNIDPMRQYLWDVFILAPGFSVRDLTFRAKSTVIPDQVCEVTEINYKFGKTNFSGRDASSHTWTCTFWESIDAAVFKSLTTWKKKQYNPETGTGLPKLAYIGTGILTQLSSIGVPVVTYNLKGVFIENLAEVPLSYDASEAVEISCTFRFDYFTIS